MELSIEFAEIGFPVSSPVVVALSGFTRITSWMGCVMLNIYAMAGSLPQKRMWPPGAQRRRHGASAILTFTEAES